MPLSLQEKYALKSICFGCGPANDKGLHVRSFPLEGEPEGGATWCEFHAEAHHQAFPGVLNGGIIGALLDCHSNWTACYHLMVRNQLKEPPCTVTADYSIRLKRPTPITGVIRLEARVVESEEDRATIEATLTAGGKVCATCRGTFVAVKESHPAFHRW